MKSRKDYWRKYYQKYAEQHPNMHREYYKKNPEKCKAKVKKYRKKHPNVVRIYKLIYYNAEEYPLDSKCIFCGATKKLEHGHLDYEDYGKNYITVCHKCNHWMKIKCS